MWESPLSSGGGWKVNDQAWTTKVPKVLQTNVSFIAHIKGLNIYFPLSVLCLDILKQVCWRIAVHFTCTLRFPRSRGQRGWTTTGRSSCWRCRQHFPRATCCNLDHWHASGSSSIAVEPICHSTKLSKNRDQANFSLDLFGPICVPGKRSTCCSHWTSFPHSDSWQCSPIGQLQ